MVAGEIVGHQKKADATARLCTNRRNLLIALRFGQQKRSLHGAARGDPDPTFAATDINILGQLESNQIDIKRDCCIIVGHDKG